MYDNYTLKFQILFLNVYRLNYVIGSIFKNFLRSISLKIYFNLNR